MVTATRNIEEIGMKMPAVGFSLNQLKAAFDKVCDKADWKAPINADVSADDLPLVMLAVEFYTATKVEITQLMSNGRLLIFAKGYRNGPAC